MFGYIFRRIILILFFISSIFFVWSVFGPNEYHYTNYHDVKIISEKTEMVRNNGCSDESHEHYMKKQIVVNWRGTNCDGETEKFTTYFDDEDDSVNGVSYQDLKNGIASDYNVGKSLSTIFGYLTLMILFVAAYCAEDLTWDYSGSERREIRKLRIWSWGIFAEFCGYDTKIIRNICDYLDGQNSDTIPDYRNLFDKYHKEYELYSQVKAELDDK